MIVSFFSFGKKAERTLYLHFSLFLMKMLLLIEHLSLTAMISFRALKFFLLFQFSLCQQDLHEVDVKAVGLVLHVLAYELYSPVSKLKIYNTQTSFIQIKLRSRIQ